MGDQVRTFKVQHLRCKTTANISITITTIEFEG